MGPENHFPAASEDVAKIYVALLKTYRPEKYWHFGCSAGGTLTAESVAWFQSKNMPVPGAIGVFRSGAVVWSHGVTNSEGNMSEGEARRDYFDVADLDLKNPLVAPAMSLSVLHHFPPTLIITGTRDVALSPAVFTHEALFRAGAQDELHVSEGMTHCAFANSFTDVDVPENASFDVGVLFWVFEIKIGDVEIISPGLPLAHIAFGIGYAMRPHHARAENASAPGTGMFSIETKQPTLRSEYLRRNTQKCQYFPGDRFSVARRRLGHILAGSGEVIFRPHAIIYRHDL